jgi:hypothetical protein
MKGRGRWKVRIGVFTTSMYRNSENSYSIFEMFLNTVKLTIYCSLKSNADLDGES